MANATLIPIEQIETQEDFNPRLDFDQDEHKALVASIKQHGVLTPLTVRKNGKGYKLIAGERRLRAAKEAGLKSVPVHDPGTQAKSDLTVALVENLVRQDLNPIEEAKGYERAGAVLPKGRAGSTNAIKALAKSLSVSEQRIKSRLALLALPSAVQDQIAGGRVPLRATEGLALIASYSERVAEAASTLIAAGIMEANEAPGDLVEKARKYVWTFDPPNGVPMDGARCPDCDGRGALWKKDGKTFTEEQVVEADPEGDDDSYEETECPRCDGNGVIPADAAEGAVELPLATSYGGQGKLPFDFAAALIGQEAVERLTKKLTEAIPPTNDDGRTYDAYRAAGSIDRDAARAYGCLMELPGSAHRNYSYVTDAEWLIAQFDAQIDGAIKSFKRSQKDSERREGERAEKLGGGEQGDAEAAKRKAEREKADAARVKAEKHNDKLYEALMQNAKIKPTVEQVKAVAALIFQATDGWLAFEGVGLTDPAFHEVNPKTGKRKYAKGAQARRDTFAAAWRRVEQAKTVEAAWGALMGVLVAADRVDRHAVALSDYRPSKLPHMSYHPEDEDVAIQKAKEAGIAAVAKSIGAPSRPRD